MGRVAVATVLAHDDRETILWPILEQAVDCACDFLTIASDQQYTDALVMFRRLHMSGPALCFLLLLPLLRLLLLAFRIRRPRLHRLEQTLGIGGVVVRFHNRGA